MEHASAVVQETKAAGQRPEEQSEDGHAHAEADCIEGASSLGTGKMWIMPRKTVASKVPRYIPR